MKAGDELLSTVFSKDHRYVIPIFQRPYVWSEEENWLPLWHDLSKAAEEVERQADASDDDDVPEYFLGAFVTRHRSPVPRRKPTSEVIDGQQRMTTLQVFLAAARRIATEFGATHAADNFSALVRNRVSQDSEHPEDRYKIQPLAHDLAAFEWAVREPGDACLAPSAHHRLVQAARWFEDTIRQWVADSNTPAERLDLLHFAVENRIKVVSIFLDSKDDPQVIFEALNHRGVRLDAADLVKNLLFQTLDRQGQRDLEQDLLQNYWSLLDHDRWRAEVTTGRIKRVRVDTLLAYWLSAQRGEESSVEHLFEDFKRWMRATHANAAEVIKSIRTYADTMDRLLGLPMTSPVAQVLDRLEATGTTTPWPLLLFLFAEQQVPDEQALAGALALDSFLMRRAICRMSTKDYNRLFGSLLGTIKAGAVTHAGDLLIAGLAAQTAEVRVWPSDGAFISGLMNGNLYNDIVRARLRTLLVGLENHLLTVKAEPTLPHRAASKTFSIEHIMPVKWEENWALPEGAGDAEHERRQLHVHSLGNLTLTTQSLNSTLSNAAWLRKRHTLQTHSLARLTTGSVLTFPIGVSGFTQDEWTSRWDEERIELRGDVLAQLAVAAWPRPAVETDPDAPREPDAGEVLGMGSRPEARQPIRTPAPSRSVPRSVHGVTGGILPLIRAGLVVAGDQLRFDQVRTGRTVGATVTTDGGIETSAGVFRAPSSALRALVGYEVNGWVSWVHVPTGKTLDDLRSLL